MADKFSLEQVGVRDGTVPKGRIDGVLQGGSVRSFTARITLAASGNGLVTQSDNVLLAILPAGYKFLYGILQNSTTLGASAQVAIGTNKAHASNGQFRASAVKTTTTQELFGPSTAMDDDPVSAPTPIYLTNGTADLPPAGTIVVEIFASAAT